MPGKSKVNPLPTSITAAQLTHFFRECFTKKIKQIRQNLDNTPSPHVPTDVSDIKTPLVQFHWYQKKVHNILKKTVQKPCELDPLPTSLLYENVDLLPPATTNIIIRLLLSGEIPSEFKTTVVKPPLKKAGLDPNQVKNYRPVSNLPYLSKILEKVVLMQLTNHLTSNHLTHKFQSAYRAGHNTQRVLLRIVNDFPTTFDANQVSILNLLDLSAAFETIPMSRLEQHFDVSGLALSWFKSYLPNRFQFVSISSSNSKLSKLDYRVPQGSVLDPILFVLYT